MAPATVSDDQVNNEHMTIWGTLSIGGLIRLLQRREPDQSVRFGFGHRGPSGVHSYRGFYDHLAIGHDYGAEITVKELIAQLDGSIGHAFTGWKGGSYVMDWDTPVWCDEPSDSSSTAIVGIDDRCDYMTVLQVRHVNV